ncbi:MAG: SH3 domain-containing protein [Spirochaetes bacterium]|nr:SH3 domain-containing protein [Spirochaetota bacterium]
MYKKNIYTSLLILFITSILFSNKKNDFDLIYLSNGEVYSYNLETSKSKLITNTNNSVFYFILSPSQHKICYSTNKIIEKGKYQSGMYEFELNNKNQVKKLIEKTYTSDEELNDMVPFFFTSFIKTIYHPLGYDPNDEDFLIYDDNGIKVLSKNKIRTSIFHENVIDGWGTAYPDDLIWNNKYLIFNQLGHEMIIQYVYEKINGDFKLISGKNNLRLGGFFEQYIFNGFYSDHVIIINNLIIDKSSIIFYDLSTQQIIKEISIKDKIHVRPFNKNLYSLNNQFFQKDQKESFYKILDTGKYELINSLENIPDDYDLYSDFIYDYKNFTLYGIGSIKNEKTIDQFVYVYNLITNDFKIIANALHYPIQFYKINNNKNKYLKSRVKNLRVRENYNLNSEVKYKLQKDGKVQVLEIGKVETIDNITDNWIKIKVKNIEGWSFKGYLY